MPAPEDRVTIRMYRQILGDCFLLTVTEKGVRKHTLIDCGVLQSVISGDAMMEKLPPEVTGAIGEERLRKVQAGGDQIRKVAQDVAETVKPGGIDLLVLTHEHYDHLSGFALAWNVWNDADLRIKKLWLAWTEDPADEQAKKLYARFAKAKQALAYAATLADQPAFAMNDSLRDAAALAAFIGPVDAPGLPAAAADPANPKAPRTMNDVIQRMKAKVGVEGTRYLEPGEVIGPEEGAGLKAYVLGPPRTQERLDRDLPGSDGKEKKVIYLTGQDEATAVASAARAHLRMAGMLAADAGGQRAAVPDSAQDFFPFARPHQRPYPADDYSSEHPDRAELRRVYENDADDIRRIDNDWTAAAGTLALKMDSDTNNTSLVLAFELPDGRVLLFPGDAQVGNWESWADQPYPAPKFRKEGDPAAARSIDDILGKVVFYKVGHHASHNATLRSRGLELMTDPRLSAAIPVVEAVAAVQGPGKKVPGKGWKMPYGHLYKDLVIRTGGKVVEGEGEHSEELDGGRIVRGDGDPAKEREAFEAEDAGVRVKYQDEETGGLWVELSFPLNPA